MAFAADPLEDVTFAVGDEEFFGAPSAGGGTGWKGTWSFEHGRMVQDRLELHFEIDPIPHTLPVRSGPAVLFAALHLSGSPGMDIGMDLPVPTVVQKAIPACDDDSACHYSVDIALPADHLPAAIERFERDGDLSLVGVGLTLVRTFGDGEWLQVLLFSHGFGGLGDSIAGRLGAMTPAHGRLFWSGLFPADQALRIPKGFWDFPEAFDYAAIVERQRVSIGDTSTPLPTVDVDLRVSFEPACPYELELVLHDDNRNHLFHAYTDDGEPGIEAATRMPIGLPWYLSQHGGQGVESADIRLGPIVSDGSPVEIDATMDCAGGTGTLELVGTAEPTPIPTMAPPSPRASAGPPSPAATARATSAPEPAATASPDPAPATATGLPAIAIAALLVIVGGVVGLVLRRGRA